MQLSSMYSNGPNEEDDDDDDDEYDDENDDEKDDDDDEYDEEYAEGENIEDDDAEEDDNEADWYCCVRSSNTTWRTLAVLPVPGMPVDVEGTGQAERSKEGQGGRMFPKYTNVPGHRFELKNK